MGFLTHCKLSSISLHTLSHELNIFFYFIFLFFLQVMPLSVGQNQSCGFLFFQSHKEKKIIYYASLLRHEINIKSHALEVNAIISLGLNVWYSAALVYTGERKKGFKCKIKSSKLEFFFSWCHHRLPFHPPHPLQSLSRLHKSLCS